MEESVRPMDDSIDTLPDEVRELAKVRNKDFKEYLHDRIKRQMEQLLSSIEDLKKLVAPSNFDADFNRQELESMLR